MKQIILTLTAAMMFAGAAQAKKSELPKNPYQLDLTGENFVDQRFNLMDDGILDEDFDGFEILVEGKVKKDFFVSAKASYPDETCEVAGFRKHGSNTGVIIKAGPDVDTGNTCDVTIINKDNKAVVVMLEATGT